MSLVVAASISPAAPVIKATFRRGDCCRAFALLSSNVGGGKSSRSVRTRSHEPTGLDRADRFLKLQDGQHPPEPDVLTCHHHQFEQFAFGEVPPQLADHRVVDCKMIERHRFGKTQRGALPRREGTLVGTVDIANAASPSLTWSGSRRAALHVLQPLRVGMRRRTSSLSLDSINPASL
jgi:hypothetical protein